MPGKLTQKRLREVLDYDPKTGIFIRRCTVNYNAVKGSSAGWINSHRYIHITIDKKPYKAHRLAWLYMYGYLPEHGIDHRDRIKHHNWIDNLREVSQSCNIINTGNRKDNKSGVKGVCWDSDQKKWKAQIKGNGKSRNLGRYKDFSEAVCHRLSAEQCLDWEGCDSSSPAYKYVQKNISNKEL